MNISIKHLSFPEAHESISEAVNTQTAASTYLVVPYGDHTHVKGIQAFDREAAEKMVKRFRGIFGLRWLKRRVPVYMGHPDDPEREHEGLNLKHLELGRVVELEAREEGLYAKVTWHRLGELELQHNKKLYFSPRWFLKCLSGALYEPVRLLSLGLTPLPNILGGDCVNEDLSPEAQFAPKSAFSKRLIKTNSETLHLPLEGQVKALKRVKPILNYVKSVEDETDLAYLTSWAKAKRKARQDSTVDWFSEFGGELSFSSKK